MGDKAMIKLADIRDVLLQYKSRYRWLDVFGADVEELSNASHHKRFQSYDKDRLKVTVDDDTLLLRLSPSSKVARFELARKPVAGAVIGASAGAAIGANTVDETDAPAGIIFGLLVGGITGALVENVARPKKVMTLVHEPGEQGWKIYNGPYISWAKEALRAS